MTTGTFRAGVQYGDWRGTTAADDADESYDFGRLLQEKGVFNPQTELIVAIEMYVAENVERRVEMPSIHAFIMDSAGLTERMREDRSPLQVKHVEVELSLEEFFGCFKRLSVVLTHRDLDLEDRAYRYDD